MEEVAELENLLQQGKLPKIMKQEAPE